MITDVIIIFFGFSVVMSFLALIIIAISVSYYRLSRSAHREREEFLKRQEQAKITENQIITEARNKAQQILMNTQAQAQQMLEASELFSDKYKEEFRAKLLQVIAKEEAEFKNLYEGIKVQSNNVMGNISKDITTALSGELQGFKKTMQGEIETVIKQYRDTAYARIEQDVNELVATITRRVLRKSISQEEHTQLVLQALQEAKENMVI